MNRKSLKLEYVSIFMNENICSICNREISEHSPKELHECAVAEQEIENKKIRKHYADMGKDEII